MDNYEYNIGDKVIFKNEIHIVVDRCKEFSHVYFQEKEVYTIVKEGDCINFQVFGQELKPIEPFGGFSENLNNNNIIETIEILYKELDKLDGSREKSICLTKLDELKMWYERIK